MAGGQACFSRAQLGRPCSRAMAAWASCRVANSPAARRRFASSFRWRRLGWRAVTRQLSAWQSFPHARGPLASGGKDSPSIAATQPVSLQLCPRTQRRPEPPRPMILPAGRGCPPGGPPQQPHQPHGTGPWQPGGAVAVGYVVVAFRVLGWPSWGRRPVSGGAGPRPRCSISPSRRSWGTTRRLARCRPCWPGWWRRSACGRRWPFSRPGARTPPCWRCTRRERWARRCWPGSARSPRARARRPRWW